MNKYTSKLKAITINKEKKFPLSPTSPPLIPQWPVYIAPVKG